MFVIYIKLFLTAVIWGGTFISGRMLGPHIDAFSAAFLRFIIASAFLLVMTAWTNGGLPRLKTSQLIPITLLGLTGIFAYNAFFFSGLKIVPAGRAALIIAMNPVAISLLSSLFFREPLTPQKILGTFLSVIGACVVISKGSPLALFSTLPGIGELLILGCVLSWSAYSLIGKAAMRDLSPLTAVTYSCVAGTICLAPPALMEGLSTHLGSFPAVVWLNVLYLGLFGTGLGFTWYYQGIKVAGPSRASVFINFVPISAVIMSYFILGERLDISLLTGAVLVCTGVFLANRPMK